MAKIEQFPGGETEYRRHALFADMAALFEFFSYDLQAVLERCVEAARRIGRVDEYALLTLDASGRVETVLSRGLKLDSPGPLQLADFYRGANDLYVVCDVTPATANPLFPPSGPIRSYICIPLVTQDDLVGLLMLGSLVPVAYADDELDLFFSLGSYLAVAVENIRHYRRAEERLKVLEALQESYRAIAKEEEIDRVLAGATDEALKQLPITSVAVYLFDSAGGHWERRLFRAHGPAAGPPHRILAEELPAPIVRALAGGEFASLGAAETELLGVFRGAGRSAQAHVLPLRAAALAAAPDGAPPAEAAGFALFLADAVAGETQRLLELFAGQMQVLFANGVLIQRLRRQSHELEQSHRMIREYADRLQKANELLERRVQELSTLCDVNLALASHAETGDMLDVILDEACTVMKADKGAVFILENEVLVAKRSRGEVRAEQLKFRLGEGIAGWVAKRGQPYLCENVARDAHFKPPVDRPVGEETLLAVPLKLEEHVLGVLSVERDFARGVFSGDDERLLVALAAGAARAFEKSQHIDELRGLHRQTLEAFAQAVDTKDAYTHGHSRRVSELSVALARRLRLTEEEIEVIERASLLHDVGKIGIPNYILFKPGKLTEEEYEIMKSHVIFGENIIRPIKRMAAEADLIRHHHERWDGRGYVDGLKGEMIPLGAAIIAVADAFDTMTSDRPYRRATSRPIALQELQRCSGTQFNPLVVGAMLSLEAEALTAPVAGASPPEGEVKPASLARRRKNP